MVALLAIGCAMIAAVAALAIARPRQHALTEVDRLQQQLQQQDVQL